jgi:(S)-ureidoglycine aminohydrolase
MGNKHTYHAPRGGLPGQDARLVNRAIFADAYALIPAEVLTDIVASRLPFWEGTRAWFLARPLSGFAETFSQYVMEVAPGGGSQRPETDKSAQGAFFVMDGMLTIAIDGVRHEIGRGGFAYVPPGTNFSVTNVSAEPVRFHWFRKAYDAVEGLALPDAVFTSEGEVKPTAMPGLEGRWETAQFIDPEDLRYDMHVNIVTLAPGTLIPFMETHVMEHGLYVLQGRGVYRLNQDWVEVGPGDFMWLRAFCPQAGYGIGDEPFRYLLYKDVNRHAKLPR